MRIESSRTWIGLYHTHIWLLKLSLLYYHYYYHHYCFRYCYYYHYYYYLIIYPNCLCAHGNKKHSGNMFTRKKWHAFWNNFGQQFVTYFPIYFYHTYIYIYIYNYVYKSKTCTDTYVYIYIDIVFIWHISDISRDLYDCNFPWAKCRESGET